jgi:hypothetical protein
MLFLDRDITVYWMGEGVNLIEYAHRQALVPGRRTKGSTGKVLRLK